MPARDGRVGLAEPLLPASVEGAPALGRPACAIPIASIGLNGTLRGLRVDAKSCKPMDAPIDWLIGWRIDSSGVAHWQGRGWAITGWLIVWMMESSAVVSLWWIRQTRSDDTNPGATMPHTTSHDAAHHVRRHMASSLCLMRHTSSDDLDADLDPDVDPEFDPEHEDEVAEDEAEAEVEAEVVAECEREGEDADEGEADTEKVEDEAEANVVA